MLTQEDGLSMVPFCPPSTTSLLVALFCDSFLLPVVVFLCVPCPFLQTGTCAQQLYNKQKSNLNLFTESFQIFCIHTTNKTLLGASRSHYALHQLMILEFTDSQFPTSSSFRISCRDFSLLTSISQRQSSYRVENMRPPFVPEVSRARSDSNFR